MNNKENELKVLHEAPVSRVAPLHHDWTKHYFDDAEQSNEEEVKKDGSEEDS